MAERTIALSIEKLFDGDHNHPKIAEFIDSFSHTIHSGDGRLPAFSSAFKLDTVFPLQLLVGVPKKLFTREKKIIAECYCAHFFNLPLRDQSDLWHSRKGWSPINTNRVQAPIGQSKLDSEWMLSLGIGRAIWEQSVLITPGAFRNASSISSTTRHLLALSVFGFSDPYQFFTASDQ